MNPSSGAEFFTQLRHPFLPFQTPPNEGIVPDEGRSQILILMQSPQLENLISFVPCIGRGSVPNERYKTVQILELRRLHKNQDLRSSFVQHDPFVRWGLKR